MAQCKFSLLLFGDTGDGKTAQIGELAEYVYRTEGKKTRLASADLGGWRTIQPYINLGIIEAIDCTQYDSKPWEMLNSVCQGAYPDKSGKLVVDKERNSKIGLYAYEGLTAFGELLMNDMAEKSARGVNIGGGGAFNFKDGDLTIGSNNMAHYGQAQSRLYQSVMKSQRYAGGAIVMWTASARRGDDPDVAGQILGPQGVGKAQTSEYPRWYDYTWRISHVPADDVLGTKDEHRLYLMDFKDKDAKGAKVLGNHRLPLGASLERPFITPASVVAALEMLRSKELEVEEAIAARIRAVTPL